MEIRRPVWAEINLKAIAHNLAQVRKISKAIIMAVVKANAYGHGSIPVAKTLLAAGAERLGVALLAEAQELRAAGIKNPIHILGHTPEQYAKQVVEGGFIQTVFALEHATALAKAASELGIKALAHIKIDTGMNRIGFNWNDVDGMRALFEQKGLYIEGAFTHLAVADIEDKSYSHLQLERFANSVARLEAVGYPIPIKHAANSAAIIELPEAHFDMVRPGIMLYGLKPSGEMQMDKVELRPAMTFKSEVSLVKNITAGESVSYGRTYIAEQEVKVATLPVGYADGYSRLLSNKAEVLVRGKRAPIIGRICMDQCMIDVSDVPKVIVGDQVILFGRDGQHILPVDELADILGTINYELVCMVSARVPRIYIE